MSIHGLGLLSDEYAAAPRKGLAVLIRFDEVVEARPADQPSPFAHGKQPQHVMIVCGPHPRSITQQAGEIHSIPMELQTSRKHPK